MPSAHHLSRLKPGPQRSSQLLSRKEWKQRSTVASSGNFYCLDLILASSHEAAKPNPPKLPTSVMTHLIFQRTRPPKDTPSDSGEKVVEFKTTFQSMHPSQVKYSHSPLGANEGQPLCLASCWCVLCMEHASPSLDGSPCCKVQLQARLHQEGPLVSPVLGTCSRISMGPCLQPPLDLQNHMP